MRAADKDDDTVDSDRDNSFLMTEEDWRTSFW